MQALSKTLICRIAPLALMVSLPMALAAQAPVDLVPPGDFDGDGFSDLVIGVFNESVLAGEEMHGAGAVHVLEGREFGLTNQLDQLWHKGVEGFRGQVNKDDRFGTALAVGDFNGDGYADLAIGVPFEEINDVPNAGAINVVYGTPGGLEVDDLEDDELDDQRFHQNVAGISDDPEEDDFFGAALASGDLNADGYTDLVIGVPGESVPLGAIGGAIHIIYGSETGLNNATEQFFHQDVDNMAETAEDGDLFGYSLATGDFNADGFGDVAVGVPNETFIDEHGVTVVEGGVVNVIYGTWDGPTSEFNQLWHQGVRDAEAYNLIEGEPESGDNFGFSLTSADYNGDGFTDLAIGVPHEGLDGDGTMEIFRAGAVNVIYGFHDGLIIWRNRMWHQDVKNVKEIAEREDLFGYSLTSGDFDGDGYDDLAVGVPHENVGRIKGAGAVNVIYGTRDCLRTAGNQVWHQNIPRIKETAGPWEMFGFSVTTGDFNGDGYDDLVAGVPGETVGSDRFQAGAVNVIYGRAAGLRTNGDQVWHQGSAGIIGGPENHDNFGYSVVSH